MLTILLADGTKYPPDNWFETPQPTEWTIDMSPTEPLPAKIDPPNQTLPGVLAPPTKQTRVRQPVTGIVALSRISKILEPLQPEDRHQILEILANPLPKEMQAHMASCERLLGNLDAAGRKQVLNFLATSEQAKG